MTSALLAIIARFLSGASVRWIDCQPDTCQRVYFANHTSHLDAIVLWSSLPTEFGDLTRPVAAKDYWERGAVRRYIARNVFNALLIDRRGDQGASKPGGHDDARDRRPVFADRFPEGAAIPAAKSASSRAVCTTWQEAARPGIGAGVTSTIMNRILPRGEFLPVPLLSLITFGPPIWLETGEPKTEFLHRAREAVRTSQATWKLAAPR